MAENKKKNQKLPAPQKLTARSSATFYATGQLDAYTKTDTADDNQKSSSPVPAAYNKNKTTRRRRPTERAAKRVFGRPRSVRSVFRSRGHGVFRGGFMSVFSYDKLEDEKRAFFKNKIQPFIM